jgi:hypothetical protein
MKYVEWMTMMVLALLVCVVPGFALTIRGGDNVTVAADEVIDDDVIAAAQSVIVQGIVTGDLIVFASEVRVTGTVGGTIIAGAATVDIDAIGVQSVWLAAGQVRLSGYIDKNAVLAGGNLSLEEDGAIGRDLIVYGGKVQANGSVDGTIKGSVGEFTLAGSSGVVNIKAEEATVMATARVAGDLSIQCETEPSIAEGAYVGGDIQLKQIEEEDGESIFAIAPMIAFFITFVKFIIFIAKILVGIVLISISGAYVRRIMDTLVQKPWPSLGWGFLGVIVIPVGIVFLFAVLIGYPFAVIGIYIYTILFFLSSIMVGLVLGERIIKLFKKQGDVSMYISLLLGLVVLGIIDFIPVLNVIIKIFVILFGAGMVLIGTWNLLKDMRKEKLI